MRSPLPIRASVLSCRSEPHVGVASAPIARKHLADILWPLRQQLPIELVAFADKREQIGTPVGVGLIVKHVGKRRTEHALSPTVNTLKVLRLSVPRKRLFPIGSGSSSAGIITPLHLSAALCPTIRVTEVAGGCCAGRSGNLGAADPWVEGRIGPFDF